MLEYPKKLEELIDQVEHTYTPDYIRVYIEESREHMKEILRRYPEVQKETIEAIEMANSVVKFDCTRTDYIQKVREILEVIK